MGQACGRHPAREASAVRLESHPNPLPPRRAREGPLLLRSSSTPALPRFLESRSRDGAAWTEPPHRILRWSTPYPGALLGPASAGLSRSVCRDSTALAHVCFGLSPPVPLAPYRRSRRLLGNGSDQAGGPPALLRFTPTVRGQSARLVDVQYGHDQQHDQPDARVKEVSAHAAEMAAIHRPR